jgi:hypothetical protein
LSGTEAIQALSWAVTSVEQSEETVPGTVEVAPGGRVRGGEVVGVVGAGEVGGTVEGEAAVGGSLVGVAVRDARVDGPPPEQENPTAARSTTTARHPWDCRAAPCIRAMVAPRERNRTGTGSALSAAWKGW